MDRILIIPKTRKRPKGFICPCTGVEYHNIQTCLLVYAADSSERLQDHWSSGLYNSQHAKAKLDNDQEMAQSERNSHSKNRDGENLMENDNKKHDESNTGLADTINCMATGSLGRQTTSPNICPAIGKHKSNPGGPSNRQEAPASTT